MRVVIGTGGTAGHIFPALATAERLRDAHGAEVLFVGTATGQEATLVPGAGFRLQHVEALPFHRRLSLRAVRAPVAALRAAKRARSVVRGADAVLAMGGYVSVPVSLAARRERVPLVLHEQNAVLGLANRVAARWASAVGLSFNEAGASLPRRVRASVVGNPVRAPIVEGARRRDELAAAARGELGLEQGRTTVLVYGGSQGARRVNLAALELASLLRDRADLQLLLVTGRRDHDEVVARLPAPAGLLLRVVEFLDRIELAYAVADLAIARAGATSVAELAVSGIPSILVPYPHATGGHQEANARALERAGAATVILDAEADGPRMAGAVSDLTRHPERLAEMSRAVHAVARPDAADALATLVASVVQAAPR